LRSVDASKCVCGEPGALPGELTALPRLPSWIWGGIGKEEWRGLRMESKRKGKERERKERGGKGRKQGEFFCH